MNSKKLQNSNLDGAIWINSYLPKFILKEYEIWYESMIYEYYSNSCEKYIDTESYICECCFFFTMTFSIQDVFKEKLRLGLMNDDFSVELDTFHLLYTTIAEALFGKKWMKKKFESKIPKAIVCVDFEGSRYGSDIPVSPKNVHVHAIWLVHPDEIEKFKKVIGSLRFKFQVLNSIHADKVKWEPYRAEKAQAGKLGSYVTKSFIKSEKRCLGGELFRIYPNSNYGGIPYRALHTYRRANRMLKKIRTAAFAGR